LWSKKEVILPKIRPPYRITSEPEEVPKGTSQPKKGQPIGEAKFRDAQTQNWRLGKIPKLFKEELSQKGR